MPARLLCPYLGGILLGALPVSCSRESEETRLVRADPLSEERDLEKLVLAEEWILAQTPRLKRLEAALRAGKFPHEASRSLFAQRLAWVDLRPPEPDELQPGLPFVRTGRCLPEESARDAARTEGFLWRSLLGEITRWERARFAFISAEPVDPAHRMRSTVEFEGLARLEDGRWRALEGRQDLIWERGEDEVWRIARWNQGPVSWRDSPGLFFRETLDDSLATQADIQRARASRHEQNLIRLFTEGKFTTADPVYSRYQDLESSHQHPGLAVVDIDGDGWDELYVMGRWGRNQLFRRRAPDGRFEDVAPAVGLDLDGYCNGAVFADFDNDGDPDAFVGRSLRRSLFLENVEGRFVDRSAEKVSVPLPFLVSSISAADYNCDGLLDVYLGLYGPTSKETPVSQWAREFFPPAMAEELERRAERSHRYLDMLGPPNLLLENRGGAFVVAEAAGTLAQWRHTYQSAWADYDDDGDIDLYVCNDFAPDALYRNEGGSFVEVSREMAGNAMTGFGMGASWSDYDRDGKLDLYVSNMFSKAGRRITSGIDGLDERILYSAQGSLLFHNDGETFRQMAGTENEALRVAKVGWSFGGLFVDADLDGYPDIYSASGYYTAPAVTRSNQDL